MKFKDLSDKTQQKVIQDFILNGHIKTDFDLDTTFLILNSGLDEYDVNGNYLGEQNEIKIRD